jgi:hypothetical protein
MRVLDWIGSDQGGCERAIDVHWLREQEQVVVGRCVMWIVVEEDRLFRARCFCWHNNNHNTTTTTIASKAPPLSLCLPLPPPLKKRGRKETLVWLDSINQSSPNLQLCAGGKSNHRSLIFILRDRCF